DGSDRTATNRPTPWGFGIGNGVFAYSVRHGEPSSTPVQITLMVSPEHADYANVDVQYSTGRWVRMAVQPDRSVIVRANDNAGNVCQLTAAQMGGATVVTMLVKGSSFSLRNDLGATASGTGTAPTGTTEQVTVNAWPNAAIGGLMVSHPKQAYQEHSPSIQWGNPPTLNTARRAVIETSNI